MLFLSAETEEVLDMLVSESPVFEKAVNKLLYVSADEELRYAIDMREKAELDYNSGMITSYRKGIAEGKAEGIAEGKAEGKVEGIAEGVAKGLAEGVAKGLAEGVAKGLAEGELSKAYKSAMRALKRGAEPEDIAYDLELPLNKVLELKEELNK